MVLCKNRNGDWKFLVDLPPKPSSQNIVGICFNCIGFEFTNDTLRAILPKKFSPIDIETNQDSETRNAILRDLSYLQSGDKKLFTLLSEPQPSSGRQIA